MALLVGGDLPQRQMTMGRLLGIFAELDETFEQPGGRVYFVYASIEADDEKQPTKIVVAGRAIFQPGKQKLFGIRSFFGRLQCRCRLLFRDAHGCAYRARRVPGKDWLKTPKIRVKTHRLAMVSRCSDGVFAFGLGQWGESARASA